MKDMFSHTSRVNARAGRIGRALALIAASAVLTVMSSQAMAAGCLANETSLPVTNVPAPTSHSLSLSALCIIPNTDNRGVDLVFTTAALPEPVHTIVYLPSDYYQSGSTRYPTLYLLAGGLSEDNAMSWPNNGVAQIVNASKFKGIVVMPEGGKAGWFTDWQQADHLGRKPLWQTFHVGQLVPWIDANLRTLTSAGSRAIAGASMGGYGALAYAAQYPNVFSAAGSFSGATDIQDPATQQLAIANLTTQLAGTAITDSELVFRSNQINAINRAYLVDSVEEVFGPYSTWSAKNPKAQPGAFAGLKVALYAGSGSRTNPGNSAYLPDDISDITLWVEYAVRNDNNNLHNALKGVGIAHRYCAGAGLHGMAWWTPELADFLNVITGAPASATCPNNWGSPRN